MDVKVFGRQVDMALSAGHATTQIGQTPLSGPQDTPLFSRNIVKFTSQGVACEAWLYLPKRGGCCPPVVILAHGMGAQKDMGLSVYAEAFAAGGLAAFVFDYRNFGGSDGQPRNWVSPARHVEDWHAAVAYVKCKLSSTVDTSRICLWGTSFAGGHVLAVAHSTPGIKAVISQVPHLDARAATLMSIKKRGIPKALLCLLLGILDKLASHMGLPPIYVPLVGPEGSLAFMQLNEFETKEYFSKHPPVYQGAWENKARAALTWELFAYKYSPIKYVSDISCPIQFVAATEDVLCPVDQVYRAVQLAQKGTLLSRECTHFELYRGKLFEGLVAEQVAFLRQQTGLAGTQKEEAAVMKAAAAATAAAGAPAKVADTQAVIVDAVAVQDAEGLKDQN